MIRSIAALAFFCLASLAVAAGIPFEQAPFEAAKKAGKPVVVMVYAEWCPTCRKQDPAVDALLKTPEFAKFELFRVDFDMQEEELRALRVSRQSTLIIYKGEKEVSRSTGETRPEMIATQLRKAL